MTERQRLDMQEQRLAIFERDNWTCKICGRSIYTYGIPQLAHRMAQSKANLKIYGPEIIHHPLNMWSVCSLKCNSDCLIDNKPLEKERLIEKIREAISKGR